MINCKEFIEQLSAWIDNELDPGQIPGMNQHSEQCTHCHQRLAFEQYTKKLIKRKISDISVPGELHNRILDKISSESGVTSWWEKLIRYPWLRPVPLTAALAGIIVLVMVYNYTFNQPAPALASSWWVCTSAQYCHQEDLEGHFTMNITESDPRALVRQVNASGQRNFQITLPKYDPKEFKLEGCKYCMLKDAPSIYLRFRKDDHLVSMEIIDGTHVKIPRMKTYEVNGHKYYWGIYYNSTVLIWKSGNLIFTVTSDMSNKELEKFITSELIASSKTFQPIANRDI